VGEAAAAATPPRVLSFRLYKHRVSLPEPGSSDGDVFRHYDPVGTLVGSQVNRLAEVRECRTTVVFCDAPGSAERMATQLSLWTSDSWLQNQDMPAMVPVLKVTYKTATGPSAAKNGAIQLTKGQYEALVRELEISTSTLPPSAREFGGCRIGFIKW